jgi:tRNA dimethylallyltransferase
MSKPPIICLLGPTCSGKTGLAIELVQQLPVDIISVDSALVYRQMDIGTAKPSQAELAVAPHRLIDIRDPIDPYSAGQFREDALKEIESIHAQGRIPLLVGGTMLYFRALQQGLADLPTADAELRHALFERGEKLGWEVLHAELEKVDPKTAALINPNDRQRIQRALEIYKLTGQTRSECWEKNSKVAADYNYLMIGLFPHDREKNHHLIAQRFNQMLERGFVEEVEKLYLRGDLYPELPSIRSVGYRQLWQYLDGSIKLEEAAALGIIATRQLAKRQMTWMRRWENLEMFDCFEGNLKQKTIELIKRKIG